MVSLGQDCRAAPAARCPALGRLGMQALLVGKLEGFVLTPAHQPLLSSAGPPRRVGKWQTGPAAFWASGRGASGLLRISPNHGSASQWAAVHLPGPGPRNLQMGLLCFL